MKNDGTAALTEKFKDWKIIREIGHGSFGTVYEIEEKNSKNPYRCALKVISISPPNEKKQLMQRGAESSKSLAIYYNSIEQEIREEIILMQKLEGHTNIVDYKDHDIRYHEDGIGFDVLIRMELLTPLDQYIHHQHQMTKREVIQLGVDICRALERCQKFHIIHRDVKPNNIFVSSTGDFKLGDFGIARTIKEQESQKLSQKGTRPYMAPEMLSGSHYNFNVDMYALGIVMYWLLNYERYPFSTPYPEVTQPHDDEEAAARRLSGDKFPFPQQDNNRLAEIILKACSYDPKDRYSSPTDMKTDLKAILYTTQEGKDLLGEELIGFPPVPVDGGTVAIFPPNSDPEPTPSREDEPKTIPLPPPEPTPPTPKPPPLPEPRLKYKNILGIILILAMVIAVVGLVVCFVLPLFKPKENTGLPTASTSNSEELNQSEASLSEGSEENHPSGTTTETGDAGYRLEKEYDDNGKLLKETQYHADGTLGFTYEHSYDEQGNLTKTVVRRADGSIWKKTVNQYKNASELLREESYENDELIYYSLYEWDENGQKTSFSRYNAEDSLEETHTFDYNDDRTYTETVTMGENGALSQSTALDGTVIDIVKVVYRYDVSGQMERQSDYDAEDELVDYCEIKYDYRFRQTQQSWYFGSGIVEGHIEYKYSEDGSTVEQTLYDANGKILLFIQNEHGADGRLTITQYDKERSIVRQEVFDEEGNLLSSDDYGTLTQNESEE